MISVKLIQIDDSLALSLPSEVTSRLKAGEGNFVYLTEAPDGYRLTAQESAFEEQMLAAERIMKKRSNVLRALAR